MDGDQPLSHEHTPLITSVTLSIISQALKEVKHPKTRHLQSWVEAKLRGTCRAGLGPSHVPS